MMQFELPQDESSIIKVIGVGGGGSNAVNHMYRLGIKGVDFIVCNTDKQALEKSPVPTRVNRVGSMMTVFFNTNPVRDDASAAACNTVAYGRFFQACLSEGLYLAPSQFEAGFLSIAHDESILFAIPIVRNSQH